MEIIPAILPKNFREIEEKIEQIIGLVPIVQIDICDGKYVPTVTWPYWKEDENFKAIISEERGMPEWEKLNYEFDLMVSDISEEEIKKWITAGALRIILHIESKEDLNSVIDSISGLVEIGLTVNMDTDIEKIRKYIDKIQYIQVMGIRKAGFQGQNLENASIEKIKEIRKEFPEMIIQVDGGVSIDNAEILKEAGANRLVAGSAIFKSENVFEAYEELRRV